MNGMNDLKLLDNGHNVPCEQGIDVSSLPGTAPKAPFSTGREFGRPSVSSEHSVSSAHLNLCLTKSQTGTANVGGLKTPHPHPLNPSLSAYLQFQTPQYIHYLERITSLDSKLPKLEEKTYAFPNGYGDSIAFKSFLDNIDKGWKAQRCLLHGDKHVCPNGHGIVYSPHFCMSRRICVVCGDNYTKNLASQAMRTINILSEHLPNLYLISINFTLPEPVQRLIDYGKGFKRFVKACNDTMYRYSGNKRPLGRNGKELKHIKRIKIPAGLLSSHNWHSNKPLVGWYPHNHTYWLNYVYDKSRKEFVETEAYLDVNKLRTIYREELVRAFPECSNIPTEVNIRTEYVLVNDQNRGKVWHMLSYGLRMPQVDVIKYSNFHGYTQYSDQETNHLYNILMPPKYWRRTSWFGWLSDGVRHKYLKLLGIDPEVLKDNSEPDMEVRCPVCNAICEYEGYTTIEVLKQDHVKFMYPWDPGGTT